MSAVAILTPKEVDLARRTSFGCVLQCRAALASQAVPALMSDVDGFYHTLSVPIVRTHVCVLELHNDRSIDDYCTVLDGVARAYFAPYQWHASARLENVLPNGSIAIRVQIEGYLS